MLKSPKTPRLTIDVLSLLEAANRALSGNYTPRASDVFQKSQPELTSADSVVGAAIEDERGHMYRMGIATMIEMVLHASGNYAGFGYLQLNGQNTFERGVTDESRRCYYYSIKLRKEQRDRDASTTAVAPFEQEYREQDAAK